MGWVGGQHYAPAALPPGKTRYPLYRRLGGPQGRSGRVRKISPTPGFDPRTVQSVASRCTEGWEIFGTEFAQKTKQSLYIEVSSSLIFTLLNAIKPKVTKHQCCWNVHMLYVANYCLYCRIFFQCLLLCHSSSSKKPCSNYIGKMWYKRAWPEVDWKAVVGNREELDGLITFKPFLINCVAEVILPRYETGKW